MGVELLPELDRAAQENIRAFKSPAQLCTQIESICADARHFELPEEPLVLYLFNPLPEAGLLGVVGRLEKSTRPLWIVYHNPLLEGILAASSSLESGVSEFLNNTSI